MARMAKCPLCGGTGWSTALIIHKSVCSAKGKPTLADNTASSSSTSSSSVSTVNQKAEQLVASGKTVNNGVFFGDKQQLVQQQNYVANGATTMGNVHPAVIPVTQPIVLIPVSEPPKREWGRILDDIAEFVASTLSETWDVAAAYLAVDAKKKDWLLLSCNSATTLTLTMIEEKQGSSFTATSSQGKTNQPQTAPTRADIASLPETTEQYTPSDRTEGAIQSLARLIEAKQKSGIYGANKDKIDRIMAAIQNNGVYCVPACNIDPEMHAEIKIINYVSLKGLKPCFDDDYIGTSKPFCPLCYAFIQWLNQQTNYTIKWKIGARRFHGCVYDRWTAPHFIDGEPAKELAAHLQLTCTLIKPVTLSGCRCYVCRQPHPIYKPDIQGRGRRVLNVKDDMGATDDIVRSRSPTRELRKEFH